MLWRLPASVGLQKSLIKKPNRIQPTKKQEEIRLEGALAWHLTSPPEAGLSFILEKQASLL